MAAPRVAADSGFCRCMAPSHPTTPNRLPRQSNPAANPSSLAAPPATDPLGPATGVVATGAGVALAGLATEATSHGLMAVVGGVLVTLGALVAGLAVGHVLRRADLSQLVRLAYLLLLVALLVAAIGGNATLLSSRGAPTAIAHQAAGANQRPTKERDGPADDLTTPAANAECGRTATCEPFD
jgi:hypothetical protein